MLNKYKCKFASHWRSEESVKMFSTSRSAWKRSRTGRSFGRKRSDQKKERLNRKVERARGNLGAKRSLNKARSQFSRATVITPVIARVVRIGLPVVAFLKKDAWSRDGACPCACLETSTHNAVFQNYSCLEFLTECSLYSNGPQVSSQGNWENYNPRVKELLKRKPDIS